MLINFTKMQGLGNDFVVIDAVSQNVLLNEHQIRHLADRHYGIGCDQLLLVEPPMLPDHDFYYRIYNADGGEVEQCGNGARCFARFVRAKGLTWKDRLLVGTRGGPIELRLEDDGQVTVNMGVPRLEPAAVPFETPYAAPLYSLDLPDRRIELAALSMGNPHGVLRVDNVETAPVAELGPLLENHPRFPNRANIGFMEIESPEAIRLRVFERGVGETLACGTGACAAVVAGRTQGLLEEAVRVQLAGGELAIRWAGPGEPVYMTGPAVMVFEGHWEL
ncbi:MAG: diaminopimelate epimerase [Gammaproteobacteria bacterium]|nr:diaminopimelate epimerase [Gammaproteobacteria bacterium]